MVDGEGVQSEPLMGEMRPYGFFCYTSKTHYELDDKH